MFTYFAHAGHDHTPEYEAAASTIMDAHTSIFIGVAIAFAALLGLVVYFVTRWQPRPRNKKK